MSFSNAWKWTGKVKSLSRVLFFATPWTAAHQAPPSMGFSRQEYWSGCHCLLQSTQQTASIFFYEILRKATCWIRFKYNLMTISQNHWQWQSIVKKTEIIVILYSSVLSLHHVQLFVTPWIAARQASLPTTNSRSLLKFMSIKSVMPSSHLILCRPLLLLPPIRPSIRVFSN